MEPKYGKPIDSKQAQVRGITVRSEQKPATASVSRLEKTANVLDTIFGGGKIGEAIGTQIARIRATPEERKFITPGPSGRELLGDVGQVGLTLATGGGVGTAGRLATRIAKTAGIGAGFGASSALKEGKDVSASALTSGAIGGAIPLVGTGASSMGRLLTRSLPRSLMQSAIGQTKAEIMAGKDVSEFALKNVRFGTADKLIKNSQDSIETLSEQIGEQLKFRAPKTVRVLRNELINEIVTNMNQSGAAVTPREVLATVLRMAPQARGLLTKRSLSLEEANRMRSLIDKTLGDRAFLTSQLPFNKDILRSFANVAREKVKTLAPGTRRLFDELSKEIRLRDALNAKYAGKARNEVVNAFDLLVAGGAGALGGIVPAAAAFGTKKLAQSAIGKTTTAVGLTQLGRLGPILEKLAPAERSLILNLVSGQGGQPPTQ